MNVLIRDGDTVLGTHKFEDAITFQLRAGEVFREAGDWHGEGVTWINLGLALREVGWFEVAVTAHRQAREITGRPRTATARGWRGTTSALRWCRWGWSHSAEEVPASRNHSCTSSISPSTHRADRALARTALARQLS